MHFPSFHPFHKSPWHSFHLAPEISVVELMNILMIVLGVLLTLALYPWNIR